MCMHSLYDGFNVLGMEQSIWGFSGSLFLGLLHDDLEKVDGPKHINEGMTTAL